MIEIIKTLCGQVITNNTKSVVDEWVDKRNRSFVSSSELKAYEYFDKFTVGKYPSEAQLSEHISSIKDLLSRASSYNIDEIQARSTAEMRRRVNSRLADTLSGAVAELQRGDLSESKEKEVLEAIRKAYGVGVAGADFKYKDVDMQAVYNERGLRKDGIRTNVKEMDDGIGGLELGSINVFAAWTGGYKTLFALNMAYNATFNDGFNGAVISLEVAKEDIWFNLLSLHSCHEKFGGRKVEHRKIRENRLTNEERDFIFNEVEPDLKKNGKGRLFIIDESDFDRGFTQTSVQQVLEQINVEAKLSFLVVDHINLLKYYSPQDGAYSKSISNEGSIINDWVSFFRKQCKDFVRAEKSDGSEEVQMLCTILLMQVNREGWKRASKNDKGLYDLRALAEANEAERAAVKVFFIYNSPALKESKDAKIMCAKNRTGQTVGDSEPIQFKVDPVYYCVNPEGVGGLDVLGMDYGASVFSADDFLGGGDNSPFGELFG